MANLCRIHGCNRPATTEDEYGPLCQDCSDQLDLRDLEEYEAAAEEELERMYELEDKS